MKKILSMAAASLVSAFCFGQTPDMSPPTELKNFDWMVGEWLAAPSKFAIPDMGEMDVTSSFKAEWDGQFLKQVSVNDFGIMKMTETMMLGYDPAKKEFFSHSFTNMAPLPRIERGRVSGNSLVMVSDPWLVMSEESVSRATVTKVDNDTMKLKLEFKTGDSWTVVNESTYKRKK